jgi:sterol desaturase/sphingolipid hydroxylase (fatty acid hydroxylase superfamily)
MFTFDIIGTSILFTAFFIEFILILLHKPDKKLVNDMMANLSLGVCVILVGLFEKGLSFSVFSLVYRYSIFTPGLSWWLWIAGFLNCDFIHYIYHRIGHKTRLFWAAHVTHHSSEHFNFSTGLRTNFIHVFYRFLFWSPLCFLGIPPEMILFFESLSAIQNFLVHTEKVGKLGILDWVFNTPSNHRVHHGSNPEYIDKNLGGILMIYDHLFGTYAKEKTQPVYGITHNINTHNPVRILLYEYTNMTREISKIKGFPAKFRYLFSRPK